MDPVVIIIFIVAAIILGGVLTMTITSDKRAKRRKVGDALAELGFDGVLADIVQKRRRLEQEEQELKNNAGAIAGMPGAALAGAQLAIHRQMLELDEFEKDVRARAGERSKLEA